MTDRQSRGVMLAMSQQLNKEMDRSKERFIRVGFKPSEENAEEVWFYYPWTAPPIEIRHNMDGVDVKIRWDGMYSVVQPPIDWCNFYDIMVSIADHRFPEEYSESKDLLRYFSTAQIRKLVAASNQEIQKRLARGPPMDIPGIQ